MLISSLVEVAIAKRRMKQAHNTHLANFDVTSLPVTAGLQSNRRISRFASLLYLSPVLQFALSTAQRLSFVAKRDICVCSSCARSSAG